MSERRTHFFSLHDLLVMAVLAALGGAASAGMSLLREASHAIPGLGIVRQLLAGVHVLWLVLAIGLVRKPGAATVTGLLKGAVELQLGNPHGLLVLAYAGLAGVGVDLSWLLLGRRHHPVVYMVAGGVATASTIWVFKLLGLLPPGKAMLTVLLLLSGTGLVSGAVLAGLLGWWLLRALRRAGVT
ncbi:MAG: ECF transporter S component [bacterium]|nr:ECF transporter S component [bacterium]